MKQRELAVWLKLIIVCCGIFGGLFCIYIAPETAKAILLDADQSLAHLYTPFLIFIWVTGIPFFISLRLGWQICSDIYAGDAFTLPNANRLKWISFHAMMEGVLYIGALVYFFTAGGYAVNAVIAMLLILFFAITIAVFTSMLSHLVRNASELKQENELTI